ncbi:MAG: DUF3808 domain-containing protein [Planctomycetaceae bacterium]|nr:DUF3808 domain-containing protein [Planctomycetaceae bacterium]
MAKKINRKVAVIGIVLFVLFVAACAGYLVHRSIQRNPERALEKGRAALAAGDYKKAEGFLGTAYYYGKTDQFQIDRLFELADFHLIQNDQHEADWTKALGCWKQIITNDPQNIAARKKLLDFYFQAADAGSAALWKDVYDNTSKIIEVLKTQNLEPDTALLKTHCRALLAMADRGETTNRRSLLEQATASLNQLAEQQPQDQETYRLLADAASIEGKLDELSGVIDASSKSKEKALAWLAKGIEQSDDKVTAAANLFFYKRQTLTNDPNQLKALRAEIETYAQQIQPNDKFWIAISSLYEIPADAAPEAELNRAIEAVRQAAQLKPQNVEYALRMARLLYRKGSAFNDADALSDAVATASAALAWPDAQNIPGPLNGRNRSYRFALNTFLADSYLQQILLSESPVSESDKKALLEKTEQSVAQINHFLGSTDNPIAEKYAGLLMLVKGQREQGIRLLYKTYERSRALDKPNELSNVDPLLCVVLAQMMKEDNQIGLQHEFLDRALRNSTPIIFQNPRLMLDYADIVAKLGSWSVVSELAGSYQNRYGTTQRSLRLLIEATIGEGLNLFAQQKPETAESKFKTAAELLGSAELSKEAQLELQLQLAISRVGLLQRNSTAASSADQPALTAAQIEQLKQYRKQRDQLMTQILQSCPGVLKPQTLYVTCVDLMRNGQKAQAIAFLDQYLPAHPDMLNLKVLRAQTDTEDPLNLSSEQMATLQEQVYQTIEDPKLRTLALSQFYRTHDRRDDALKVIAALSGEAAQEPDILRERFEIALEKEDTAAAEGLLGSLRSKNADGCEGTLNAAQLEIMKKNYPLALRRLDECVALKPLDSTIYFLKSQIYQQQQDFQPACESATKAVQMNPQNPVFARNLASVLFARNSGLGTKVTVEQKNEAQRAITNAMILNPSDWQLQSVYAESIQLQAPDDALRIRKNLLESYPNASNAVMLGNMAQRMAASEWDPAKKSGLIETAGKSFEKAIALDPDYQPARQAYADYLQMTKKEDQAVELIKDDENMLWKFYLRNGQFENAAELLGKLIQKTPEDPMLLRGLIMATEGQGDRGKMKGYLDQLAKVDTSKDTELLILQKYLDIGFEAEAEQRLAGFKERYPNEKAALLIEAWIQMGQGQLDEAMTLTNRYLEGDTNHAGAWRLRGRLDRLMNQPQKAIDDLQRSKSLQDTPAIRIELATVYMEARQTSAAIGELTSGLENPQAPIQMRLMLERIYAQNQQTSNLEKLYKDCLTKYPESVFWHSRAGRFYMSTGQLAAAQPLFQKAWDLSRKQGPGDMAVLFNTLDCLCQMKKYDEAFSLASGLIDTDFAPVAYAYIGQIQVQKQQKDKAIESFGKALDRIQGDETLQQVVLGKMITNVGEEPVNQWVAASLAANPKSLSTHLLVSQLAQSKGLFNKALESVEQCLTIAGKEHPAWLGLMIKKANLMIQVYSNTSDAAYLRQSIDLFKTILEIQPENVSVLNNLAYLLADNNQDLDVAVDYARKAYQREPGNAVYLDTYGFAQCKKGQYADAERNLLRAIELYERAQIDIPWDLYKHLGMAREGLGRAKQAAEAYQQAIDLSADSMGDKKQEIPATEKQKMQELIQKLQQS